jgi:hypothetical protein
VYVSLLEKHNINYEIISEDTNLIVESTKLLNIEKEWDELYSRYSDRAIVELLSKQEMVFKKGSILLKLDEKDAVRAAMLIEPTMLYGLYQYHQFNSLINEDGIIPVYRIVE